MPEKIKSNNKIASRLGIVVSKFNVEVTQKLLDGTMSRLAELSFKKESIDVFWVPGAVEIPLVAQRLAMSKRYGAVIALGSVIRGETNHYDYVCEQVSQGCLRVALDHSIPVIFGVLTTDNPTQALQRVGEGLHNHKGREAADAALSMIELLEEIKTSV